jgi:hypothetical protein
LLQWQLTLVFEEARQARNVFWRLTRYNANAHEHLEQQVVMT